MILDHLEALESALVARGFPPMSQWWRDTIVSFYQSGKRQLVVRVGRRGGKSSTLCRLAVLEALYGQHVITPGDTGVVAFVSTVKVEAQARIRTISAILKALGVPFRPVDGGVELKHRPIAFRVFPCTVAATSGFTSICVIADEVAKWKDSDQLQNPATEVLAALRPTMATQKNAKIILSSSVLGTDDAHAQAFDIGDTDFQQCATAKTWEANPSPETTEEACRALEPDPKVFLREYGNEPQGHVSDAFEDNDTAPMFDFASYELRGEACEAVLVFDPSDNKPDGDAATAALVHWQYPSILDLPDVRLPVRNEAAEIVPNVYYSDGFDGWLLDPKHEPRMRPKLCFTSIGAFTPGMSAERMAERVAYAAQSYGARRVVSDQHAAWTWKSLIEKWGLEFHAVPYTQDAKIVAMGLLRRLMRDRQIVVPHDVNDDEEIEALRSELRSYRERIRSNGKMSYAAAGRAHDDRVSLLVTAALGCMAGLIPGSPITSRSAGSPGYGNWQGVYVPRTPSPTPQEPGWHIVDGQWVRTEEPTLWA